MVYLTGDTHRDFSRVNTFWQRHPNLSSDDVIVVLGDAGINHYGNYHDIAFKYTLRYPFKLFCIHGNHEMRPSKDIGYHEEQWQGGTVFVDEWFPNILFAKDGEVYDLDGRSAIVIGGAYSVDKSWRLANGAKWFTDEQPDEATKRAVETTLDARGWKVDFVLSHTCPAKSRPTWAFLPGLDESTVDTSTEEWLGTIEQRLTYQRWFCGHFHIDMRIDQLRFLYEDVISLN